jgi:hypothetical protein
MTELKCNFCGNEQNISQIKIQWVILSSCKDHEELVREEIHKIIKQQNLEWLKIIGK